jgi:hypothetical protein
MVRQSFNRREVAYDDINNNLISTTLGNNRERGDQASHYGVIIIGGVTTMAGVDHNWSIVAN